MIEKQVILNAFRFYRGNKTQCSISLGISIRTLENKLEKYEADGIAQRDAEIKDEAERAEILDRHRGIIPSSKSQEGGARIYGANAGVHVQSAPEVPAQQSMPMPQSEKVQSVLPKQAPGGRHDRRR